MNAHCRSPQTCSVCLGVAARKVELRDGQVLVDGVVDETRTAEQAPVTQRTQNSMRRGGATRTGRSKP